MKKIETVGRIAKIAFLASIVLKALIAFFKVLEEEGLIGEFEKKEEESKD